MKTTQTRIQGHIANAVEALRVADAKLGKALHDYGHKHGGRSHDYVDQTDLLEAQLNARLFARLLAGGEPLLSTRVFRAIANHQNADYRNAPHAEGAVMALKLAQRSLEAALDLAGDEFDEAYEVPFAALGTIRSYVTALSCTALIFEDGLPLDAIIANKPSCWIRPAVMMAA